MTFSSRFVATLLSSSIFAALSDAAMQVVLPIVSKLRAAGVAVDLDLAGRKPAAVAKHADAIGAKHLVIVGDRDLVSGRVDVKELATGKQETVAIERLIERLA